MLIPTAVMDVDLLCCIRFIIGISVGQAQRNLTRFAENVWKIPRNGRTDEEMAEAGVEALADFIRDRTSDNTSGSRRGEKEDLKEIADSCYLVDGSYKKMTHEEILEIFLECLANWNGTERD